MVYVRALHFVAKRGLSQSMDDPWDPETIEALKAHMQIPPWGAVLIIATVIAFMYKFISIQYSIGHIMTTCAMIESPETRTEIETRVTLSEKDEADAPLLDVEQVQLIKEVNTKPITSSIRMFRKHLFTFGRCARWQGLHYGIIYAIATVVVAGVLEVVVPHFPGHNYIVLAGASMATVPLHCAWTHATIAVPNRSKSMRARFQDAKAAWKKLLFPVAFYAITEEVVASLSRTVGRVNRDAIAQDQTKALIFVSVMSVFTVLYYVFVTLRIHIVLVRLEAAFLPEDEDTIVYFDRTFGGTIEPAVVAGSIGKQVRNALAGFSNGAFRRVIFIGVKLFFINFVLVTALTCIVFVEMFIAMGNDMKAIARTMHEKMHAAPNGEN